MNTEGTPGLQRQAAVRNAARVASVVLLVAGAVLLFRGISAFAAQAQSMEVDSGFGPVLTIAAGGFCVVFGLGAAQAGWLRAGTSYVAGETMPVVRDSLTYATASGPFCRQCGTRNDGEAKFCDSCGSSLA
jgi:hypothetical protein